MTPKVAVGLRFGRMVVIERTVLTKRARWLMRCDCGVVKEVSSTSLLTGNSNSCGCIRKEILLVRNIRHGMSKDRLYSVWASMIERCTAPRSKAYPNYGGRGITVCDRWRDYQTFKQDVGERPSPKHSLDRINNDLGYSPENVRWAVPAIQSRNTRRTKLITYKGRTQCLQDWSRELGIGRWTLNDRLYTKGMSVSDAFTKPKHSRD